MDLRMTDIPQFKLPFQLDEHGQPATVEQGSGPDLVQRIRVLIATEPGTLRFAPTFGLADQAHSKGGPDPAEINQQLTEHIADADTLATVDLTDLDQALSRIGVRVSPITA